MAKKKKGSMQQSTDSGLLPLPKTSPYTDSPIALRIGRESREYHVPRHLLQNLGSTLDRRTRHINLPDVDENTGHVLAHYLHTGNYQTLDNVETSLNKVHVEFKRAVLAYRTAETYEIAGLQQLAIHEIEQYGTEMTIFDVIQAVNADYSKLVLNTNWLQEYLTRKLSTAFKENYAIFATDNFFDHISNADLCKFAIKCVAELYSNRISRLLCTSVEVKKDPVVRELPPEKLVPRVLAKVDVGTPAAFKGKKKKAKEGAEEELSVEEAPPLLESGSKPEPEPVKEEPLVELSQGLSKKEKKKQEREQKKKDEAEAERKRNEEEEEEADRKRTGEDKEKEKNVQMYHLLEPPVSEPLVENTPVKDPYDMEEHKAEDLDDSPAPSSGKKETKMSCSDNSHIDATEKTLSAPVQKVDEEKTFVLNIGENGKEGSGLDPLAVPSLLGDVVLLDDVELPPPKEIEAPLAEVVKEDKLRTNEEEGKTRTSQVQGEEN